MRRIRLCLLLLLMLSLPLLGGALPLAAEVPPPLDAILADLLPEHPGPLPAAVSISAGESHTCAVTGNGDAYCWGNNSSGQLGNGTTASSSTPVKVLPGAGLASGTVATVIASGNHTCATTTTGDAYCWGNNGDGRLGDGTTTARTSPVKVLPGAGLAAGTVRQLTLGGNTTCAATTSGDAYCWGHNSSGQLGDGTTTTRTTPVKVLSGSGLASGAVATVAAGGNHTCATTIAGETYCWGDNTSGQLGNGTFTDSSTPVKVSAGVGLTSGTSAAVTAGLDYSCATTTGGDAYCWGYNANGQLGNGTTTNRNTPAKVSTGAGLASGTVATTSAGNGHTCATTTTGDAYCWGDNSPGELGDGSGTASSTPVKVAPGAGLASGSVASITAGDEHSCAVTHNGEAYCWGSNASGRLGDGTTSNSATPVKVALSPHVPPKHCDDDRTRVDRVDWGNGANEFSVDVHEKPDGVYTCVYAERNGEVLVDEVMRVRGDVITIDEDAPPGNGPDSPCTENHSEGGTSSERAYVRSTPSDAYPASVCAGITTGAGNRHVRITVG